MEFARDRGHGRPGHDGERPLGERRQGRAAPRRTSSRGSTRSRSSSRRTSTRSGRCSSSRPTRRARWRSPTGPSGSARAEPVPGRALDPTAPERRQRAGLKSPDGVGPGGVARVLHRFGVSAWYRGRGPPLGRLPDRPLGVTRSRPIRAHGSGGDFSILPGVRPVDRRILKHIITVVMENHDYDNLFGSLLPGRRTVLLVHGERDPDGTCVPYVVSRTLARVREARTTSPPQLNIDAT